MNEQIKVLAEQAIEERLTLEDFIVALKEEPHDFYAFRVSELTKFAELIVQECLINVGHYADVDEGIAVTKRIFEIEE